MWIDSTLGSISWSYDIIVTKYRFVLHILDPIPNKRAYSDTNLPIDSSWQEVTYLGRKKGVGAEEWWTAADINSSKSSRQKYKYWHDVSQGFAFKKEVLVQNWRIWANNGASFTFIQTRRSWIVKQRSQLSMNEVFGQRKSNRVCKQMASASRKVAITFARWNLITVVLSSCFDSYRRYRT